MKIGIISDIHEDSIRLSNAIVELEKRNCNTLICLGDIVGFDTRFYNYASFRNQKYCIDLIKTNCTIAITGNHDLFAIQKLPTYPDVFDYPKNWYSLSMAERKSLSKGLVWLFEHDLPISLSDSDAAYLDSLPYYHILEDNEMRVFFSHSLFPDLSGMHSLKPLRHNDLEVHFKKLADINCDFGISGHFHPNGVLKINNEIAVPKIGKIVIDDSPAQYICPCIADGTQNNGFSILDTEEKTIEAVPLKKPKHNIFW